MVPPKSPSHEPRIAANQQEGQESEQSIPNGDSPEASVSRGVVSSVGTINEISRHADAFKATILRVWRPK